MEFLSLSEFIVELHIYEGWAMFIYGIKGEDGRLKELLEYAEWKI